MGPTTKAGAIDLLAQLGINGVGSHYAASSPTLRWQWGQGDTIVKDYRFGGLVLGALAFGMGDGDIGRMGYDLAAGAGHSLLSTEMVRRQAIARAQQPQQPQQIPAGAPPFGSPVMNGQPAYPGMYR